MRRPGEREPDDLAARKRALREELLRRRVALPDDRPARVGARIAERLARSARYERARSIALYAASGGEPDLRAVFDRARRAGKRVALPRCIAGRRLTFHAVDTWEQLAPGRFGLLEPPAEAPEIPAAGLDWVLAPAVAVDRRGGRLGRGGGWYDRAFPEPTFGARVRPLLVAVVNAFQVVDTVPAGPLDRVVDGWVSEDELHWVRPPVDDEAPE